MRISSRSYYALRAIYELAEHTDAAPLKIAEIAERQHIPLKFLEAILNHLKGGGFVRSWRGAEGGYRLARPAESLTIGEVLRFMEGPIAPVECVNPARTQECEFLGQCPFFEVWCQILQSISDVVDRTTFADLVRKHRTRKETYVADWTI
jgi:Rrf2 family transcriptional regulator, cysteine metabolism repressor